MTITFAQKKDYPAIVDIYNQAIATGQNTADTELLTLEERAEWFASHTPEQYPLLVAKEAGTVVGYLTISAYRYGRKALIHTAEVSYYIHFDHHRKGIASQLMDVALKISPSLQIKTLIAILIGSNQGSIGLLKKYGFKEWGCMPDIVELTEGKSDHVYYGLHLN